MVLHGIENLTQTAQRLTSMVVGDTVYIGSNAFVIEVIAVISREALLKYQEPDGLWKILGWRSFDDFKQGVAE